MKTANYGLAKLKIATSYIAIVSIRGAKKSTNEKTKLRCSKPFGRLC